METYKGFNKDMTAKNGYQYEEGKEYEEEKAVACECGFHESCWRMTTMQAEI